MAEVKRIADPPKARQADALQAGGQAAAAPEYIPAHIKEPWRQNSVVVPRFGKVKNN